jgi:hypothetical protein
MMWTKIGLKIKFVKYYVLISRLRESLLDLMNNGLPPSATLLMLKATCDVKRIGEKFLYNAVSQIFALCFLHH